jgi:hypothetical protein
MHRALPFGVVIGLCSAVLFAQNTPPSPPSSSSAVVTTYCVSCHSGRTAGAGLQLDRLDADHPAEDADVWERVVRQLRARTMPPVAAPRPDDPTYEATISALTLALDRTHASAPASDAELAARLAKFIWNTEPDQQLRDDASKGRLGDAAALRAQARRMLSDPKSAALVSAFFEPWLSLDQLETMKADPQRFPEFDDELRGALRRETALFLESQLREDHNPLDLWTSNYTYLNERLARHYGIPNVSGPEFRRVAWPGSDRAGLLGQGSVLTMTSYFYNPIVDAPSTSPAARAKWIRTRFLGVNPPTPLQGIPGADFPFEKHVPFVKQSRTFPATPCLACHRSFFPLSYGLENFDVLGRWRADYGSEPIDASGAMVDGTTFNGPAALRRALLERRDAFYSTLAERLMAFSIGGTSAVTQFTPSSRMPAVRAALREAAAQNDAWSSLIAAIVRNQPAETK